RAVLDARRREAVSRSPGAACRRFGAHPTPARLGRRTRVSGSVLAIVPARGGSKSIPRKNLQPVAGRPLIAWTIDAARRARAIDRVVVWTEDDEIAEVARAWGAEVPVRRPAELAGDDTPGIEPVLHIVRWLDTQENSRPELIVVLQPTSPMRRS